MSLDLRWFLCTQKACFPQILFTNLSQICSYTVLPVKKKKKVFDCVVHSFSMAVQSCWVCPDPKNRKTADFRMAFNCVQAFNCVRWMDYLSKGEVL